jgi:hypothetical protein
VTALRPALQFFDCLQKQLFRFWIRLEGFISLGRQYGDRRPFGQITVDLNTTTDDLCWRNSHPV